MWIVLVHGIVRRRVGRGIAIAIAAVLATAPILLLHTDQLLSEYPHAMVLAAWVWWLDRVLRRSPLIGAGTRQLVTLGVLGAAAYNVRRESIILIAVILVTQLVELVRARRARPPAPVPWLTVATPHLAFLGSIVFFQLLIPSMLVPDNGDSPGYVLERMGDFTGVLTQQLGIGAHPLIGTLLLLLALAGMVVGCIKRPRLDVPLAALTVLTALTVSTHFRIVGRYYFQIVPFILYFAAAAVVAGVQAMRSAEVRRAAVAVAMLPLVFLVGVHAVNLPSDLADVSDFNAAGRAAVGPDEPRRGADLRRRAAVHGADGHRGLLPGADDDALHGSPVDPDAEHRADDPACRLLRPAALLFVLPAQHHRGRRPRPRGWSRCGRTAGGSSGSCPGPRPPPRCEPALLSAS